MNDISSPVQSAANRRGKERFPLKMAVRYRHPESLSWTSSECLNISSSGLLFSTSEHLLPEQPIEVFLAWPALLEKRIPIKLVINGRVVRRNGECAAISIEKYEFKTRGSLASGSPDEEDPLLAIGSAPDVVIV